MKVLLDVDADFMVGNAYGYKVDQPQVTGKEYGKYLKRFKKKGTQLHLMIDHHESLYHWDQANVRDALCIHIDAHHDMWEVPKVEEPIVDRNLVDFQDPRRGLRTQSQIDCGNYLHQAMIDSIVDRVIYVPAPFRTIQYERADINAELKYSTVAANRVRVRSWEMFKVERVQLPKADIITIAVSPEWTPRNLWGEIEDLCRVLCIDPDVVSTIRRKAVRKWNSKSSATSTDTRLDFKFPYRARIV